jgi:CubicO group peptidase (beta-lactamase class C family)
LTRTSTPPFGGDVEQGYGSVADAFRRNLSSGRETGAAVAVFRDGRKVVDLWGGYRDPATAAPWRQDTLVNVFSTTKGIAALMIAVAVSRGWLDYDAKIADYWPEFAQAGKGDITVRQLLAHQAGLVAITPELRLADIADPASISDRLAAQTPEWTPGSRHGYHAVTLGWYQSELLRRVDPQHRSIGRFLAEEITSPHGIDFHIGLPASIAADRVAVLEPTTRATLLRNLGRTPPGLVAALFNKRSLTSRAFTVVADVVEAGALNVDELRRVEIPSVNGTTTATAVACLYGDAATGGPLLGLSQPVRDALAAPVLAPALGFRDQVMHTDMRYTLGFGKPRRKNVFGSSGRAFGWPGMGGSFGFADPDTGVGFAYVMNRMGGRPYSDPRELALRQALFRDVLHVRSQS